MRPHRPGLALARPRRCRPIGARGILLRAGLLTPDEPEVVLLDVQPAVEPERVGVDLEEALRVRVPRKLLEPLLLEVTAGTWPAPWSAPRAPRSRGADARAPREGSSRSRTRNRQSSRHPPEADGSALAEVREDPVDREGDGAGRSERDPEDAECASRVVPTAGPRRDRGACRRGGARCERGRSPPRREGRPGGSRSPHGEARTSRSSAWRGSRRASSRSRRARRGGSPPPGRSRTCGPPCA